MNSRQINPLHDIKPLSPITGIEQTTSKDNSTRKGRERRFSAEQYERSRAESSDQIARRVDRLRDDGAPGVEQRGQEGDNKSVWEDWQNDGVIHSAARTIERGSNHYNLSFNCVLRREDAIVGQHVKESHGWAEVQSQYQVEFDEEEWDWMAEREKELEGLGIHVKGLGTLCSCGGGR